MTEPRFSQPPEAPQRSAPGAAFANAADALIRWLIVFRNELASAIAWIAAAVATITNAVNAKEWSSGTNYAAAKTVWSPSDLQVYRAINAHTSTVDPASDSTNWALVGGFPAGHIDDTDNPHGVTAAQVGALSLSGGTLTGSVAAPGILLGGTDQANLLDDYEEGTFAPYLTFDGSNHGMSYLVRAGRYRKVGSLVYARFGVRLSAKGTSTGVARIDGLPFVNESVAYADSVCSIAINGGVGLPSSPQMLMANGGNWGHMIGHTASGFMLLNQSHFNDGSYIMGTAVYNTV